MKLLKATLLIVITFGLIIGLVPSVRNQFFTYAQSLSKTLQLAAAEKYTITCSGGTLNINPVNGKEISGRCDIASSNQPTPTPTTPSQPSPTPTPVPGEVAVGKCGESMNDWHAPVVNGCATGHEHGDAPPQWIADAGYKLSFAGAFNTSAAENTVKHTSMKGYLVRFSNTDIYVRYHWASNPQERFGTFHSYEVFAKDPTGKVSHWQLWNNLGQATNDRLRCLRTPGGRCNAEPDAHLEVINRQSGSSCEQWYSKTRGYDARWGFSIGLTICGVNAYYQREKEQDATTVFNQSTWDIAGGKGLTRRIELTYTPTNVPEARGKFWSTQFGQIVSGPNDPRCSATTTAYGVAYKNICMEQVIQQSMPAIGFPSNSIQRTFSGQGVQIPN